MGRLREVSARPGARRRWAVLGIALAVLIATPAVIAARPVSTPSVSTSTLLERMHASANTPYEGYAETSGRLAFPDLGSFSNATALLSQTSRLRIWSAAADHYRIDQLSTANEHDYYRDGGSGYEWDSGNRRALVVTRYPAVREPTAPMVTPPALGRQLLDSVPAADITRIGGKRVAGRATVGLRVPSKDPRSLIDHVDVWLDPDTGQPLAVRVVPRGQPAAAFDSRFLEYAYRTPSSERLTFRPNEDPTAEYGATVDGGGIDGAGNRRRLPTSVDGLQRRSVADDGTATYGDRFSLVGVIPVDASLAYALRDQIDSPTRPAVTLPFGDASEVLTPMVNAAVFASGRRGFLVLGSVDRASLERVAADLAKFRAFR